MRRRRTTRDAEPRQPSEVSALSSGSPYAPSSIGPGVVGGPRKEAAMRTLVPWNGDLRREMERFLDRFADPVWQPVEMVAGDWAPKLNMSETKDAMVVTAE